MLPPATQTWILHVIRKTESFLPIECWHEMVNTLVEEHGLTPELAHQAITEAHKIVIDSLFDGGRDA